MYPCPLQFCYLWYSISFHLLYSMPAAFLDDFLSVLTTPITCGFLALLASSPQFQTMVPWDSDSAMYFLVSVTLWNHETTLYDSTQSCIFYVCGTDSGWTLLPSIVAISEWSLDPWTSLCMLTLQKYFLCPCFWEWNSFSGILNLKFSPFKWMMVVTKGSLWCVESCSGETFPIGPKQIHRIFFKSNNFFNNYSIFKYKRLNLLKLLFFLNYAFKISFALSFTVDLDMKS